MGFTSSHNSIFQSRDFSSELDFATLRIKHSLCGSRASVSWVPSVNILTKCLLIYRPIQDQYINHVLANMSTDNGHHSTDWYVRRCSVNTRLILYWHLGAPIWQTRFDGWKCRKLWKDLRKHQPSFYVDLLQKQFNSNYQRN